jgi:hypothetical protein
MVGNLLQIVEKYRPSGILKGVELLLPPEVAISLIDELSQFGVMIWGCDLWRFLDPKKDPKRIVALVGAGILVDDPKLPEIATAARNAKAVKEFIQHRLPEDAELISLIFDDAAVYDVFGQ